MTIPAVGGMGLGWGKVTVDHIAGLAMNNSTKTGRKQS